MPLLHCFSFCSSHNFSMQSHVYGPNDMGRISDTAGKRTRERTQHQHQCPENYTIPPSLPTQRSTRQLTPSFIRTEICDVYYCHYYISFFLCFCFSFSVSLSAFFFLFCFIAFEKLRVSPLPLSRVCSNACIRVHSRRLLKKCLHFFLSNFYIVVILLPQLFVSVPIRKMYE